MRPATGLLDGVRVLDLSVWRPGPYATRLLVELGADVVKVEPPGGDPMRVFPTLFAVLNAGKRSGTVDLKVASGRDAVQQLAHTADVVVEGFRPGVAGRLGVDEASIRAINASVVYCSISGYGQDGPLATLPGHDVNYQAWAGILEPRIEDEVPVVARPPIADLAGGVYAALGICAALVRRETTGEGEVIDVSMADVLATWTGAVPPLTLTDDREVGGAVPGYGTFRTADGGWVALGVVSEDHLWANLARALDLHDVAALSFEERLAQTAPLTDQVAAAVATRGRDELVSELAGEAVPVAPVLSQAEVLEAAQFRDRGTVVEGADGEPSMGHPLRYRDHPARTPREVPPLTDGPCDVPSWAAPVEQG